MHRRRCATVRVTRTYSRVASRAVHPTINLRLSLHGRSEQIGGKNPCRIPCKQGIEFRRAPNLEGIRERLVQSPAQKRGRSASAAGPLMDQEGRAERQTPKKGVRGRFREIVVTTAQCPRVCSNPANSLATGFRKFADRAGNLGLRLAVEIRVHRQRQHAVADGLADLQAASADGKRLVRRLLV